MTKDADMYKLQFVKTSSAPATPVFSTENMYASTKPNYILKDMVSPQTYLRFDITNLTDEENNALATHSTGDTEIVDLYTGGLDRYISRLDCACRRKIEKDG